MLAAPQLRGKRKILSIRMHAVFARRSLRDASPANRGWSIVGNFAWSASFALVAAKSAEKLEIRVGRCCLFSIICAVF
jgi:hypothetical protein